MNPIIVLLIALLLILIISFIGKWIWNHYLVNNVSFAKPMRSWVDFLMLYILIILLFGGLTAHGYVNNSLKSN